MPGSSSQLGDGGDGAVESGRSSPGFPDFAMDWLSGEKEEETAAGNGI